MRDAGVAAAGDRIQRRQQAQEVQLAQLLLVPIAVDAAGFDQHRAGAPLRGQVAEGARIEGLVPARDVAVDVGIQRDADGRGHLDRAGALRGDFVGLVGRRCEQGDGRAAVRVADPVVGLLVVQVEAERRAHAVVQCLEGAAFRRGQHARVAVDVDALRVAPLEARRAIGIEQGQDVQGGVGAQALHQRMLRMLAKEGEQVGQRHRAGAFVAMHLRPQQYRGPALAPADVAQRPAFHAAADVLDPEAGLAVEQGRGGPPPRLGFEIHPFQTRYPQLRIHRVHFRQPRRRWWDRRGVDGGQGGRRLRGCGTGAGQCQQQGGDKGPGHGDGGPRQGPTGWFRHAGMSNGNGAPQRPVASVRQPRWSIGTNTWSSGPV